jgi:hypothetical protein
VLQAKKIKDEPGCCDNYGIVFTILLIGGKPVLKLYTGNKNPGNVPVTPGSTSY